MTAGRCWTAIGAFGFDSSGSHRHYSHNLSSFGANHRENGNAKVAVKHFIANVVANGGGQSPAATCE